MKILNVLKPRLIGVLRDKSANNLVVAILMGLSFVQLVSLLTFSYGPGLYASQWWSMAWRQLVGILATLVVAELISRLAKK